ncbi:hypothetical protein CA833_02325 [Novosphingobium sp. KA1]|nr:hypothetical protein CA833_02325 [Novosphingobium sp. KA1]
MITGEVNGKNSYGAYTGFKPFFYADSGVVDLDHGDFSAALKRCYGHDANDVAPDTLEAPTLPEASESTKVADQAHVDLPKGPNRFPYVAPDGVDIRNATDEANWKKYGTTDPDGGE